MRDGSNPPGCPVFLQFSILMPFSGRQRSCLVENASLSSKSAEGFAEVLILIISVFVQPPLHSASNSFFVLFLLSQPLLLVIFQPPHAFSRNN